MLAAATARRATGYLPLTHAAARSIPRVRLSFLPFIGLMILFWIVAFAVGSLGTADNTRSAIAVYLGGFGVFFMLGAIFVALLTHRFGPTGLVFEPRPGHYESIVELRGVHPSFVSAVHQHQQARADQVRAQQLPPPPVGSPYRPGTYTR